MQADGMRQWQGGLATDYSDGSVPYSAASNSSNQLLLSSKPGATVLVVPHPVDPTPLPASDTAARECHACAVAQLAAHGSIFRHYPIPAFTTDGMPGPPLLVEFSRSEDALSALHAYAAGPHPWFSVVPLMQNAAMPVTATSSTPSPEFTHKRADNPPYVDGVLLPAPTPQCPQEDLQTLRAALSTPSSRPGLQAAEPWTHPRFGSAPPQWLRPPQPPRLSTGGAGARAQYAFDSCEALHGGPGARCTLMLRNVPCRWQLYELFGAVQPHIGVAWDVIYLPCKALHAANAGYAFVNVATSLDALRLYDGVHGRLWPHTRSAKLCEVCYARLQGQELKSHLLHVELDPTHVPRGYLAVRGADGRVCTRQPTSAPASDAGAHAGSHMAAPGPRVALEPYASGSTSALEHILGRLSLSSMDETPLSAQSRAMISSPLLGREQSRSVASAGRPQDELYTSHILSPEMRGGSMLVAPQAVASQAVWASRVSPPLGSLPLVWPSTKTADAGNVSGAFDCSRGAHVTGAPGSTAWPPGYP